MCDQQRLRPDCEYAQSDKSLCQSLDYSMILKLLTEHHLEFLSLIGGCRGLSESRSTFVKMPNCWKSHVTAQNNKWEASRLVISNSINRRFFPLIIGAPDFCQKVLYCRSKVTVMSCFVYKVIRDLESINHLCINPICRIGLILK